VIVEQTHLIYQTTVSASFYHDVPLHYRTGKLSCVEIWMARNMLVDLWLSSVTCKEEKRRRKQREMRPADQRQLLLTQTFFLSFSSAAYAATPRWRHPLPKDFGHKGRFRPVVNSFHDSFFSDKNADQSLAHIKNSWEGSYHCAVKWQILKCTLLYMFYCVFLVAAF
jgi:hypothetical protein